MTNNKRHATRRPASTSPRRFLVHLALALLVLAVFAPVRHFDFVTYDDFEFVVDNPHVATGLTWANVRWAFANAYQATGGPVTWLSHMADVEMFGLDAGAHHMTSVVFHLANTLLLFAALWSATGAVGRSASVAALFAVHPLHVESVAWIAERKDVLSTFFTLLAVWAYLRPVGRVRRVGWTVVALFALALMSKPMVVTLPFVLLLIDVWPLGRWSIDAPPAERAHAARVLVREKLPLFLLSAIALGLTFAAQRQIGAVAAFDTLPLSIRASNAALSYVAYIGKMFWPVNLAPFYPYRVSISPTAVAAAALAIAGATAAAVLVFRRAPFVTIGWLWYIGMLVPVIGLVQVGGHAMADRFTYLPLIGLFIVLVWSVDTVVRRFGVPGVQRPINASVLAIVVIGLAIAARRQTMHWENGVALWEHAIEAMPGSARAHANLGVSLARDRRRRQAIDAYREALKIDPQYAEAHNNLALALAEERRLDEAIDHYTEALRIQPGYANAHTNLANLLDDAGRTEEAIGHYRAAIRADSAHLLARLNLAVALARTGRVGDARTEVEAVLRIDPRNETARTMLEDLTRRK